MIDRWLPCCADVTRPQSRPLAAVRSVVRPDVHTHGPSTPHDSSFFRTATERAPLARLLITMVLVAWSGRLSCGVDGTLQIDGSRPLVPRRSPDARRVAPINMASTVQPQSSRSAQEREGGSPKYYCARPRPSFRAAHACPPSHLLWAAERQVGHHH